jgi:hypothetical protein
LREEKQEDKAKVLAAGVLEQQRADLEEAEKERVRQAVGQDTEGVAGQQTAKGSGKSGARPLQLYQRQCAAVGIRPQAKVEKCLHSPVLDLKHYGIGARGAIAIGACLHAEATIRELCLTDNVLGEAGGYAIAHALVSNKNLTRLDLRDNRIGSRAASAVLDSMSSNTTLTSLTMERNLLDDAISMQGLFSNKTLTLLDLNENSLVSSLSSSASACVLCDLSQAAHSFLSILNCRAIPLRPSWQIWLAGNVHSNHCL